MSRSWLTCFGPSLRCERLEHRAIITSLESRSACMARRRRNRFTRDVRGPNELAYSRNQEV